MPVRTAEFRLYLCVALVAKLWLLLHQQRSFRLRVVRRMAADTANVIAGMGGAGEIGVLVAIGMAAEATLVSFRHAQLLKDDNLAFVASAFHVCGPRAVAGFAIHALARGARLKSHLVVGRSFGRLEDVFVTSFARFGTYVLPSLLRLACGAGLPRALFRVSRLRMAQR